MTSYRFANNAESTLSGAITAGATSLTVVSAAAFPTAGNFTILVGSEIMLVTGVAGTIFTLVRGQEGTSAAAHDAGATVQQVVSAEALESGLVPSGTAFPAAPSSGDRFYRADLLHEFTYNGTYWLSTHVQVKSMVPKTLPDYTAAATAMYCPALSGEDWWIEDVVAFSEVTGLNNASNFWNIAIQTLDGAGAVVSPIATFSSVAVTAFDTQKAAINLLAGPTIKWLGASISKSGAPGNLSWLAVEVTYRLVAT